METNGGELSTISTCKYMSTTGHFTMFTNQTGNYGMGCHHGTRIPDGKNKQKQTKKNIKQKNKKTKTKLKNNKKNFFRNLTQMVKQTNKK